MQDLNQNQAPNTGSQTTPGTQGPPSMPASTLPGPQEPASAGRGKGMIAVLAIVVILLVAAAVWVFTDQYSALTVQREQSAPLKASPPPSGQLPQAPAGAGDEDTTSAINEDLDAIDLGDLDVEFDQIDSDIDDL